MNYKYGRSMIRSDLQITFVDNHFIGSGLNYWYSDMQFSKKICMLG